MTPHAMQTSKDVYYRNKQSCNRQHTPRIKLKLKSESYSLPLHLIREGLAGFSAATK